MRAGGRNSTSRFICLPKSCTTFPVCAKRTALLPPNIGNGAIRWNVNLRSVKAAISKAATNHPLLRTLAQTKQLAEHYTYLKPLTEFDEYEFKFAVNRVLVDSESCTFELKTE